MKLKSLSTVAAVLTSIGGLIAAEEKSIMVDAKGGTHDVAPLDDAKNPLDPNTLINLRFNDYIYNVRMQGKDKEFTIILK